MTEAELLVAASNNWSDVISLITIFISAMSGYLVVAYFVAIMFPMILASYKFT